MTALWHDLFEPTNRQPEASHEAFSGAAPQPHNWNSFGI
jgi:hypothetical protein